MRRNDFSDSASIVKKLSELEPLAEDDYHLIPYLCIKYMYCYKTGNCEHLDDYLNKILVEIAKITSIFDFFIYIVDLCDILYESGNYEYIIEIAHILEKRLTLYGNNSPFIKSLIESYKIKYYKAINNEKHYKRALRNYHTAFEEGKSLIRNFNKTIIDSQVKIMELAERNRKTKDSIEQLRSNAEHDQLTGLYNYGYIKDVLETLFIDAAARNECLGVAIIDIDFFKQYNDNYGHQMGDDAIRAVAGVIDSISGENVITSRYGGDEFIVIFKNMSDDLIIDLCNKLRRGVLDLAIEHKGSTSNKYVTISIGARNSVPHKANKTWDYLYAADMALYDVKEFRKGGFQLVHRYLTPKSKAGNKENIVTIM